MMVSNSVQFKGRTSPQWSLAAMEQTHGIVDDRQRITVVGFVVQITPPCVRYGVAWSG